MNKSCALGKCMRRARAAAADILYDLDNIDQIVPGPQTGTAKLENPVYDAVVGQQGLRGCARRGNHSPGTVPDYTVDGKRSARRPACLATLMADRLASRQCKQSSIGHVGQIYPKLAKWSSLGCPGLPQCTTARWRGRIERAPSYFVLTTGHLSVRIWPSVGRPFTEASPSRTDSISMLTSGAIGCNIMASFSIASATSSVPKVPATAKLRSISFESFIRRATATFSLCLFES